MKEFNAKEQTEKVIEFIRDYYKENNSIMYVSYGIGNEKTNLRFLNKL